MPTITIIHYTAPTKEIGGVESVMQHPIQLLAEVGYQIKVFFGSGGGLELKNVTEYKIPLARAARKPLFCSRIPPFQELIREDIEGFMFDLQDDLKNIAFRIFRLLEDRVNNNFDNVTKKYLEFNNQE